MPLEIQSSKKLSCECREILSWRQAILPGVGVMLVVVVVLVMVAERLVGWWLCSTTTCEVGSA